MKKMIIALILLIPLIFMFTVFSVVQVSSLQVNIPVNGIEIKNDETTIYIDIATYKNDKKLNVNVSPINAANKKYSFVVSDENVATVTDDGVIVAKSVGTTKITTVSNDGGYKDSVNVVVESSKTFDLRVGLFSASDENHSNNLVVFDGDKLIANVTTGRYFYEAMPLPFKDSNVKITVVEGNAQIDEKTKTILLPYEEQVVIYFEINDGKFIKKRMQISVSATNNESGILIDGEDNPTILIDKTSLTSKLYIYSPNGEPSVMDNEEIKTWSVSPIKNGGYVLDITYNDTGVEEVEVALVVGEKIQTFTAKKANFAFNIKTDLFRQTGDNVNIVLMDDVIFYTIPVTETNGVTYEWKNLGGNISITNLTEGVIKVKANGKESFTLMCYAKRDGEILDEEYVNVNVVGMASSATFLDDAGSGLADINAIGDKRYVDQNLTSLDYYFKLNLKNINGENPSLSDFNIYSENENIASVVLDGERLKLVIKKTGEVTVKVEWKGNINYGTNITAEYTFVAVKNGVEVYNYDELRKATESKNPVVLRANINLGAKADNTPYSLTERQGMVNTMRSTYNTEFLKASGRNDEVKYAMEFKSDVFGNGFTINAEYIAKAEDATGKPLIFTGSLPLVGYWMNQNQLMKISAQDNISFLIRTDGVTLSNVTLAGCFDESLIDNGKIELNKLNNVGTVLEINADCKILNCRIKNGKTAVRAYGGNKDGDRFLVNSLDGNDIAGKDRIEVEINGSIISVAREFLIKSGANRALRANRTNGDEPNLVDRGGNAYDPSKYNVSDEYFYNKYVMTDLTLKNSVLENSGLFAFGMESNFSGTVLNGDNIIDAGLEEYAGDWKIGGTMFASAIRLEGDVRFYDWKSVNNMDSSGLIEVYAGGTFDRFKLDIKKLIESVVELANKKGDHSFDDIFTVRNGEKYVNSAMVKYGGGKNYANIDTSKLNAQYVDFARYDVNIGILKETDDKILQDQGTYLPLAAGTRDFNFYLYSSNSKNSLDKQLSDHETGRAYEGVIPVKIVA